MKNFKLEILIRRDQIEKRITKMGQSISKKFSGKAPIFICVLNGGFVFFAEYELARKH